MVASISGHTTTVQALIGAGADINLQDQVSDCACSISSCVVCEQKCGHCLCLYWLCCLRIISVRSYLLRCR
jgi:hypothetical protein